MESNHRMDEEDGCSICLEKWAKVSAYHLKCKHKLCILCVNKLEVKRDFQGEISCPFCRSITTTSIMKCPVCAFLKEQFVFCIDCESFFCQICRKEHTDKFDVFKDHFFMEISAVLKCEEHDKVMKYICQECHVDACCLCVHRHREHSGSVVQIKDALTMNVQQLQANVQKVKDTLNTHKSQCLESASGQRSERPEQDVREESISSEINVVDKNKEILAGIENFLDRADSIKRKIDEITQEGKWTTQFIMDLRSAVDTLMSECDMQKDQ